MEISALEGIIKAELVQDFHLRANPVPWSWHPHGSEHPSLMGTRTWTHDWRKLGLGFRLQSASCASKARLVSKLRSCFRVTDGAIWTFGATSIYFELSSLLRPFPAAIRQFHSLGSPTAGNRVTSMDWYVQGIASPRSFGQTGMAS